jgi:hypothetical protein
LRAARYQKFAGRGETMSKGERDLPLGHPSASDYDAHSPEAREWARTHNSLLGERDFPVDHPGAADNPDRVEPTHPQATARDYSRPDTILNRPNEPAREKPDGLHTDRD